MSDLGFRLMNSLESDYADHSNFEFSDFLVLDELPEEDPTFMASGSSPNPISPAMDIDDSGKSSSHHEEIISSNSRRRGNGPEKKKEVGAKVAFKTKSELEILDDGFRWRKYGKKMVKNSPNPRNYYRCSVQGCPVKKRVERDVEDPGYVITTYEGVHTHHSPSI